MFRNTLITLILAAGLIGSTDVWACGAFTPAVSAQSDVTLDAQRAVLHLRGDRLEISLQVAGSDPSADFAWVLPIPADDTATVDVGDPALFAQLDEVTRPQVEVLADEDEAGSGCGCGGAAKGDTAAPRENFDDVDVFAAGMAGDYEYTIVGGDQASSVIDYLQEEGFAVSTELDGLLTTYLDVGMRFVAVKLAAAAVGEAFTAEPLVIDLARPAELMYPLALSAASAPEETELLIYVIGDDTHVVDRALMLESKDVANELAASGGTYRSATKAITFEAPDSRFVIDAAGPLTAADCAACELDADRHVTRIYAVLAESDLRDLIIFGSGQANGVERNHTIAAAVRRSELLGYALVPLLLVAMRLRRRLF